jgi:hypothetical protein
VHRQRLERQPELACAARRGDDLRRRDPETARVALRAGQPDTQAGAGDAGQREPLQLGGAVGDHKRAVRGTALQQRVRLGRAVDRDARAVDAHDVARERVLRGADDLRARVVVGEGAQEGRRAVGLVGVGDLDPAPARPDR